MGRLFHRAHAVTDKVHLLRSSWWDCSTEGMLEFGFASGQWQHYMDTGGIQISPQSWLDHSLFWIFPYCSHHARFQREFGIILSQLLLPLTVTTNGSWASASIDSGRNKLSDSFQTEFRPEYSNKRALTAFVVNLGGVRMAVVLLSWPSLIWQWFLTTLDHGIFLGWFRGVGWCCSFLPPHRTFPVVGWTGRLNPRNLLCGVLQAVSS